MMRVSKCGGIPMYPTESLWKIMCETCSEDYLETYKSKAEQYYKKFNVKFPWD